MFTSFPFMLLEILLAVAAIMGLDFFMKGWRGWRYYGLAFIAVLAVEVSYMVMLVLLMAKGR